MLKKLSLVLGVLAGLCLFALIVVMVLESSTEDTVQRENLTLEEEFEEYKEAGGKGLIPHYKEKLQENGTNQTSRVNESPIDNGTKEAEEVEPPEEGTVAYVRHASQSEESCLTVIEGKIYNITGWIEGHPDAAAHVQSFCGAIATGAYEEERAKGFIPRIPLDKYLVGVVEGNHTLVS